MKKIVLLLLTLASLGFSKTLLLSNSSHLVKYNEGYVQYKKKAHADKQKLPYEDYFNLKCKEHGFINGHDILQMSYANSYVLFLIKCK